MLWFICDKVLESSSSPSPPPQTVFYWIRDYSINTRQKCNKREGKINESYMKKNSKSSEAFASLCRSEILRSHKISRSSVNFSETFFTLTMNSGREIILILIRCSQEYHFHSFSMTFHDKTRTETGEGLAQLLWAFFAHTQKGSAPNHALKSINLWLVNKNAPNFQLIGCRDYFSFGL